MELDLSLSMAMDIKNLGSSPSMMEVGLLFLR